jgi:glycosyltransferase involved in cell wall biosynthesis
VNVLVLTTSWPVRQGAISGSFVRDLLRGLTAHGMEFEVVTPAPKGAVPDLDESGIRVHVVPHPGAAAGLVHGRGLPETLAAAPWTGTLVPPMLAALGRAATLRARERRFDRVWSHWLLPCGWIGAGIARAARLPHRITAHGSDIHTIERLARVPGLRTVMAHAWRASALSATSHTAAGRIARVLPGRRVSVCPLPAVPGISRPEPGPPALLFLGRFEPIKGPDLLLEASATLAAGELARVTLAGSGSLDDRLRERARQLAHPVEFPGVIGGVDKRSALERAHALVVPSRRMPDGRSDGLPHAALEALAVGTPVIAPGEGPLGDLLRATGAGIAYPADPDERRRSEHLSAALRAIVAAPGRLAELRARARTAGRRFQPRAALRPWLPFLAECGA